ncbi:MAG TPA: hypothetical protein DCG42_09280 [Maribacter sp.]|nr:hypothetical protein [Maribacter sp.]|tara:strand:+ start:843 stop:1139 length:297 start_codon:yes stop_codon:yes gene_type:complete
MEAIKKLQAGKIFGPDSIIETYIEKSLWGTPTYKKSFLKVKKLDGNQCICEEVGEADGKAHKIRYLDILTVDGQEPNELAAVYGLGPKTARFKKRSTE